MFDRIFSGALTFCLLAAGTLAVGSALFGQDVRSARTQVIQMPTVNVVGQRSAANEFVAPKTGARPTSA